MSFIKELKFTEEVTMMADARSDLLLQALSAAWSRSEASLLQRLRFYVSREESYW
jgi:hypothetical protein